MVPNKTMRYDRKNLDDAVTAVRTRLMGYKKASKVFGVPKTTIIDHVCGRYTSGSRPGRPPVLPPKIEEALIKKVIEAANKGFGISKKQLLLKVLRLCTSLKIKTPFKNGCPGDDWWQGLKMRHPELVLRKPEKLTTFRARMLNRPVVQKYFDELNTVMNTLDITKKPHLIWNLDETGKQFEHTPVHICSAKGKRNVTSRVSNSRENITVLACVNACGQAMPPMCVCKGKTEKSLRPFATLDAPEGTFWTYQERAWMCDVIGEEWFREVFLKHCGPERPQLLILDSHSSHEVIGLLENAAEENISILALPPHTTHALQPLDKQVFGPFSKAYNRTCTEFLSEHPSHVINKATWPRIFRKAWDDGITCENITAGFRSTGIYPLNPKAVSESLFAPSLAFDKPLPQPQTSKSNHTLSSPTGPSIDSFDKELDNDTANIKESTSSDSAMSDTSRSESSPTLNSINSEPEDADLSALAMSVLMGNDDQLALSPAVLSSELPATCVPSSAGSLLENLSMGGSTLDHVTWNLELDNIFSLPKVAADMSAKSKRSLTGHRILTSEQVLAQKRAAIEDKTRKLQQKAERKRKVELKKIK
ncbi:uncharacterized protein LOC121384088 [Gigantopelta aegis]|uniref:uncharacterized protein LOC121384088 n=1 Tax=Gigantopelta aegis TaxID=1735272 RepID=UPI001B888F7E|nr:uncharacterized protein LOC121384088 [Gigantopelta aegis]